ncbi:hypothetical protein [Burkholderia cenocepacia]|uniref:hypothetical protein n=2 Tax=Burkholderia cenocepacia TaxID=95486 RepID=UPI00222EAD5A|nr:hypothetical protein [Burkholderia cenocepacia]MCW3505644.1 hypothetical protein [Burkholderia cenocepacia]MCW3513215.1 hypothetical protein [Burkholderia cenocepacia]MCW3520791.1 hypothetical protein [Burkholderia cenocepacia]MCW3535968.1 hypothetical protein [Burkholderia cenocepacia]MCW3551054.1 hypothetical protein [Burkholderia cenocepacia]
MRNGPVTLLIETVDTYSRSAEYQSPHDPAFMQMRAEFAQQQAVLARRRKPSYEQRLRARLQTKRI